MVHLCGCWQETSVSHHMDMSLGVPEHPHLITTGFQVVQEKERKLETTMPFMSFSLKSHIVSSAFTISQVTLKGKERVCVRARAYKRKHCLTSCSFILIGPISST